MLFYLSIFITWIGLSLESQANDRLWELADQAYNNNDSETGNRYLKDLIESDPGNISQTIECLEKIYERGDRNNSNSRWMRYVTSRIASLEKLGHISANAPLYREIISKGLTQQISDRNLFVAAENHDDIANRNPYDLYWKSTRARAHKTLGLATTRDLFEDLKKSKDMNHPDPWTRERWVRLKEILESDFRKLPQPLLKPLEGSPMPDLSPDDPDGRWQQVIEQPISRGARQIDRLIGVTLLPESIVPWRDMTGIVDASLALDLHLQSFPDKELEELRKVQERSFKRENLEPDFTNQRALELFRRYPWSNSSHKTLLRAANRDLIAGHALAALRSFEDLLNHANDPKIIQYSKTGKWAALSMMGDKIALSEEIDNTDPDFEMIWMSEKLKASELGMKLLSSIPDKKGPSKAEPLSALVQKKIQIPAVSPWFGGGHPGGMVLDTQIINNQILVSSRNHLALYDTNNLGNALWSQPRLPMNGDQSKRNILPGYFTPKIKDQTIYSRWGFMAMPQGIAAFDLSSGKSKWLHDDFGFGSNKNQNIIPISDPVISDGLIYELIWNSNGGQRLQLACIEETTQSSLWTSTIAEAGKSSDIVANLEKSRQEVRNFGNRVSLHGGSIYVNSNAGLIAKCDPRDGKPDWIHYYSTSPGPGSGALGSHPIIFDDLVICITKDSGKTFALQAKTGKLVWENTLTLGIEYLGRDQDNLIIRGQFSIAAINLKTGQTAWHTKVPDNVIGRSQMIGSLIYLADIHGLTEFNASNGAIVNRIKWNSDVGQPLSFRIDKGSIYIISDNPSGGDIAVSEPINPDASTETQNLSHNLKRQWSLMRSNATIIRAPHQSLLSDHAFILSDGLLECIEISPKGQVKWRRFINAIQPAFQIIDNKLLLLTGSGQKRQAVAFDGKNGKMLWQTKVPPEANLLLKCGSIGLLHDKRTVLFAFDPANGKRLWQRRVAYGNHTIPQWDGKKINVFQTSMGRAPWHLKIEPRTGQLIEDYDVNITNDGQNYSDGKLVGKGFYEIKFNKVEARYIRLVMKSEVNGMGWSSAAEINLGDENGENIDRSKWRAHYTNSYEPKSRMNTELKNVFDGNPSTWWHTQWIGKIPPHPHEIQLDLGNKSSFSTMRYLPAVIINNNGMISEYELYASDNPGEWGQPIAKGIMVRRLFIDKAQFFDEGVVLETRDRKGGQRNLYSYFLNGKKAIRLADNHEMISCHGKYLLALTRNKNNQEVYVVLKPEDKNYRFEIGTGIPVDRNQVIIENDILCFPSHKFIIANLAEKKFIISPTANKAQIDQHGYSVRINNDKLMKFFNGGDKGATMYFVDLKNGNINQSILEDQTDAISALSPHHIDPSPKFEKILLLRSNIGISAYSTN